MSTLAMMASNEVGVGIDGEEVGVFPLKVWSWYKKVISLG